MINNFKSTPYYTKTLNLRTIRYICTNNNYQVSSSNSKMQKIKFLNKNHLYKTNPTKNYKY